MTNRFAQGLIVGLVLGVGITISLAAAAIPQIAWKKDAVIPVCPVKGAIGGFEPIYGNAIGNKWDIKNVLPVCEVTTGIGGFVPVHGNTIGNNWSKDEVKPFVVVIPTDDGFVAGPRF